MIPVSGYLDIRILIFRTAASMELFNQRIESTTTMIKLFKAEQERQLFNAQDDRALNCKVKAGKLWEGSSGTSDASSSEIFMRMLNTDCVIMPHCKESKSYQKLWPQALIVNRSKNCAEVGLIESHGSLWRIVPCNEGSPGSKVMLQTAERGEVPRYLGPELDIVDLKVDAAVWAVKIVPPPAAAAIATSALAAADSNSRNYFGVKDKTVRTVEPGTESEGVVVLFELVNGPASVATLQQQQSGGPGFGLGRENGNGKEKERELLVCETSRELRCYSELFVEPVAVTAEGLPIALHSSGYTSSEQHQLQQGQGQGQGQGQEEGGHPTYRSCHWELFAESWIQNDLDFLEGFIH